MCVDPTSPALTVQGQPHVFTHTIEDTAARARQRRQRREDRLDREADREVERELYRLLRRGGGGRRGYMRDRDVTSFLTALYSRYYGLDPDSDEDDEDRWD